ncbi:MAG: hypothetical protein MUC43_05125 [Pirellula sp.]|jgi:hypothetical protein|nr:hypothetical protein [Pirellula sp.]
MKSFVGYLVGLYVLLTAVGCTGIRVVQHGGYGPYDPSMPGCDSCGVGGVAPVGCDSGCGGPGVLHRVADRLRSVNCNTGCGEVYWDEQINEPRVCDPCCFNGGYVGGSDCGRCPGGLARLRELWGFRYVPSDCNACASTHSGHCESCSSSGAVYEQVHAPTQNALTPAAKPQPTPAAPPAQTGAGDEIRSVVEPKPGSSAQLRSAGPSVRVVSQPRAAGKQSAPRLTTR